MLGESATSAGHVIAVGSLLMALIAPIAGALSDRLHPSRVEAWGVAIAFGSARFSR